MPLSAELQRKLALANFSTPTAIQAEAIPHALAGRNVLATAQTGTGKTLAFLVPLIERLLQTSSRNPEALILVPTRELAMQVHEQYEKLRDKKLAPAALVIGGLAEKAQIQALRSGARVIVATPGRLEDFLGRRLVRLDTVKTLVLDEADRMLDMGFLPAIRRIAAVLPRDRQTLCFSATLEASVAGLVNDYMRSPVRIAQGSISKPADTVELPRLRGFRSGKVRSLAPTSLCGEGSHSGVCSDQARYRAPGQELSARRFHRCDDPRRSHPVATNWRARGL